MEYKIKVNYDTGDSFGEQPDQELYLEMTWKDIDVAKENIKRIAEHAKAHSLVNGWSNTKKAMESFQAERWYYKNYPDYSMLLLKDDGTTYVECGSAWNGYFESFNYAEVVPNDEGMRAGI